MGECEMSRNGFPNCEREYNRREEAVEMAREDQLDEQSRLNAMGQEREARLMAELAEVKRESLKLSALVVERDYQITLANKGYDYEGAVEDARHYKEMAAKYKAELEDANREIEASDIANVKLILRAEQAEKELAEVKRVTFDPAVLEKMNALEAELAGYKADADRYRWLRDMNNDDAAMRCVQLCGAAMDEAIDEAIKGSAT